jgi:hypothetical protein
MMKRPSKYQLIFEPPTLMVALRLRFDQHIKKWGCEPRKIFVPQETFEEYRNVVGWRSDLGGFDGGVWFRGAQVLPIGGTLTLKKIGKLYQQAKKYDKK